MKKALAVLSALAVVLSFAACEKKTTDTEETEASESETTFETEISFLTETSLVSETVSQEESLSTVAEETSSIPGTVTKASGPETTLSETVRPSTTTTDKAVVNKGVYACPFEQNWLGNALPEAKATRVRKIIGKYKMDKPSYDNLPDYCIVVDGVYYSYQSDDGIITRDDTHADKLTDSDRRALNNAIGAPEGPTEIESQGVPKKDDKIITDVFIIKDVNGTNLTMVRYDRNNREYKEGLYSCNYGNIDGSDKMSFNVGDVVTVRYDPNVMETYPMQIIVYEIYPAEWN